MSKFFLQLNQLSYGLPNGNTVFFKFNLYILSANHSFDWAKWRGQKLIGTNHGGAIIANGRLMYQ
nr:hypothetical protein [Escherichia coli]